ncbi:acetyl-CoA hydrolase/transferase family protein [Desulfarculus baarsii]
MYQAEYAKKLVSAQQAAARVQDGWTLIHGLTMAEPPAILGAIAQRLREGALQRLRVYSLLPLAVAGGTILDPLLCDRVEALTWFVGGGDRGLVDVGLNYFVPNHFHQVPRLIEEFTDVDVFVTTVSPMDKAGYFSFGTSNDYSTTAARRARLTILEVNRHMPRVFGQSQMHVSEVGLLVENHQPIAPMPHSPNKPEDAVIGQKVAELIPHEATLQLGVGALPNAVADYLGDHKDLGIHTEVLGPGMIKLIKAGVVSGAKKTLHPRKHVFTVAQGDDEMLAFMDDNPAMESYPVSYVNRPAVIARNRRMISVNTVIEVDLTGQCNAESLAGHQFSGAGGQLDFVRGAFDAPEGKSILAFRATAKGGAVSKIVGRLECGSPVTTPRTDVHWLVTEFGAVNLKGMATSRRALAIIDLAHPDFRDDLRRQAEDLRLI